MAMKIIVEDKDKQILQEGDMLLDNSGSKLCVVVKIVARNTTYDGHYCIRGLDQYSCSNLSARTLEELTCSAIHYNYTIYSQDEYEVVLRKK